MTLVSTRILAVDDDDDVLSVVKMSLEQADFEVVTAKNGCEALSCVADDPPDVILMDVAMPQMDGFTALQALKENPATAHIPVVLLTAMDADSNIAKGYKLGTDLYLRKPFLPAQLISYVRFVLELP